MRRINPGKKTCFKFTSFYPNVQNKLWENHKTKGDAHSLHVLGNTAGMKVVSSFLEVESKAISCSVSVPISQNVYCF